MARKYQIMRMEGVDFKIEIYLDASKAEVMVTGEKFGLAINLVVRSETNGAM